MSSPAGVQTSWTVTDRLDVRSSGRSISGFLTTAEFLPQHREQLTRTERLIVEAQADGRHRLVEMNEPLGAENQRLREANAALKAELAIAYGQQRVARHA
jgi:hypothetical protein